jgi:hypothetical protein
VARKGEPGQGSNERKWLVGTSELHPWPSMKVTYDFSAARSYVLALLKEEPGTVLVTNREQWYFAEPRVDRSRLHSLQHLQASYISGPARILIVAVDPQDVAREGLYWFAEIGKPRRVDYFDRLDFRLIRRFPEENLRILETRVPDGIRIALDQRAGK